MAPAETDFTKLGEDGVELEQLVRELCLAFGFRAAWSGKGPDAGRDLIVHEPTHPDFGGYPRKWLVSCKHTAIGGGSVGYADVGDVPGRLAQHGCQGFLLVTTTQPSAGLIESFEAWETGTPYLFHYWDAAALRGLLLRDAAATVVNVFFSEKPAPPSKDGTEAPSDLELVNRDTMADGMAHYIELRDGRTFYFETRKEPDDPANHLQEFELGFDHLDNRLPAHLPYAVRGVWFDDKHSNYEWRVDFASRFEFPPEPQVLSDRLSEVLVYPGDWGGQWHDFQFRVVDPDKLDPVTERVKDEDHLQLFGKWPDEPPEDYGR